MNLLIKLKSYPISSVKPEGVSISRLTQKDAGLQMPRLKNTRWCSIKSPEVQGMVWSIFRKGIVVIPGAVLLYLFSSVAHSAVDLDQFVQWRRGDMSYYPSPTDDRPNRQSISTARMYYKTLIHPKTIEGRKGKLKFTVFPRSEEWAGVLVLDAGGKPISLSARIRVEILDRSGNSDEEHRWLQFDTKALFTDASRIYRPTTTLRALKGRELLDEAVINFSECKFERSKVNMSDLLDGPTDTDGFVLSKGGSFVRDGKQILFWGGHENHIPSKATTDRYVDVYPEAGINVMRHIGIEEMVKDPVSGEIDPKKLDDYHYLVAQLGKHGIYLFISQYFGYLMGRRMLYGYPVGKMPKEPNIWLDQRVREGWKRFLRNFFNSKNPYNGKRLKDDPTIIGFELSNETGLNYRRFDFNNLRRQEFVRQWRTAFNQFLLKKYGSRSALAEAWKTDPLFPWEDPKKGTVMIPSNFRGARCPYGGRGQHDQFTTGRFYKNGLPPFANPRIVDAVEFHELYGPDKYPFDYNNLAKPDETRMWREKWNKFLLDKYGARAELAKAWANDPLFRWEDPARNTILIPTNYHGERAYYYDPFSRIANPRIGDMLEFTYLVQKEWATDMAKFLKEEIGLKCAVGWNGDTFQVIQLPSHKANMDSPLDVTISAVYLDWDNGDQLTSRTKNLKRFTTYGRIYGRPIFSYEWSAWTLQGPYVHEYILLTAIMGRVYGFDGFAHHKMSPLKYPISDPLYSLKNFIHPLSDRRRGAFCVASWILKRSRIPETRDMLIIGYPDGSAFTGGPERKMSNPAFENWLLYQLGSEDYSFKDVYNGPTDRIVVHSGHGPYGDYRKAKHAILWCHSNTDREGKDTKAKQKWFALHGISFKPGQKYYLDDHYFATTEDLTEYVLTHRKAEETRWRLLEEHPQDRRLGKMKRAEHYYWSVERKQRIPELDRWLYKALKRWGYPLPFEMKEIDRVWRSPDGTMVMDTTKEEFIADRDDMQVWFGRMEGKGGFSLSRLAVKTSEKQYSVALLPWDTASFSTSKVLMLWTQWNSRVTIKLPFPNIPRIYAVNWLGRRIFRVVPLRITKKSTTFMTARHDDIFCYEILR